MSLVHHQKSGMKTTFLDHFLNPESHLRQHDNMTFNNTLTTMS